MYQHILIATDGSGLATKAVEHGLALAKQDNARVTVITVTEPPMRFVKDGRIRLAGSRSSLKPPLRRSLTRPFSEALRTA